MSSVIDRIFSIESDLEILLMEEALPVGVGPYAERIHMMSEKLLDKCRESN